MLVWYKILQAYYFKKECTCVHIIYLPTVPAGVAGLNAAVKHSLVSKHECMRPLMLQGLLKMLILSGLKEALTVTDATLRDLRKSSV